MPVSKPWKPLRFYRYKQSLVGMYLRCLHTKFWLSHFPIKPVQACFYNTYNQVCSFWHIFIKVTEDSKEDDDQLRCLCRSHDICAYDMLRFATWPLALKIINLMFIKLRACRLHQKLVWVKFPCSEKVWNHLFLSVCTDL